ncbi:MAG: ankyrin repeat domain-containing protein [Myxococcales bacterium]|nr:ankyrin repeat domain-containing protein [Myxococcales bacterium]
MRMIVVLLVLVGVAPGCDRIKKSTPLIDAVRAKDSAKVAALLKEGANVNATVRDGTTPLIAAAATCQWPLIKTLVEKGAKVDVYDASKTSPLMYAVYHCSSTAKIPLAYTVVRYLIEKGAQKGDLQKTGFSPAMQVCLGGREAFHPEAMRYYLETGLTRADAAIKSGTPLHCAASRGLVAYATLLLKHGAKIDARDTKGQTALHLASDRGHVRLVRFLLSKGADPKLTDKQGRAPYYYASALDVRIALLQHGVDPSSPHRLGAKPPDACKAAKTKDAQRTCLIKAFEAKLRGTPPAPSPSTK